MKPRTGCTKHGYEDWSVRSSGKGYCRACNRMHQTRHRLNAAHPLLEATHPPSDMNSEARRQQSRERAVIVTQAKNQKRPKLPDGLKLMAYWKGRKMGVVEENHEEKVKVRNPYGVLSGLPRCDWLDLRAEEEVA